MKSDQEFIALSTTTDYWDRPEGDNQKLNFCGVQEKHAYAVLELFPLYNAAGDKINYFMLMIRDPYGKDAVTRPEGAFSINDPDWTEAYKAQVPYGLDPTDPKLLEEHGIFFMEAYTAMECFYSVEYSVDRSEEGYKSQWYEVDADPIWGEERSLNFTLPAKDGDVYISV